jgi:hypothetical protein
MYILAVQIRILMVVFFSKCLRIPVFILLVLIVIGSEISAQKVISGNINQPQTHVKSILSASNITVDDITGFNPGDTVLLIQMQGVGILTEEDVWGAFDHKIGAPGLHEFLIIQSITPPDQIVFRNNIIGSFNVNGIVQIVRVPYYNSVKISDKLYTDPWDSGTKKGGVLVIVAGRSIILNADIDVTGIGLTGGKSVFGIGECQSVMPTTGAAYNESFKNSGYKGEGIAIYDKDNNLLFPNSAKGQNNVYTGGGGGNGRYAGGGGGANHGNGGKGGFEDCDPPGYGGYGGYKIEAITDLELVQRIFFGGGGGSATSQWGNTGKGGNGGGIVILITDTIIGNGRKIIADGENGSDGAIDGGAGGGGGGGSIALSAKSYGESSPLVLSAKGGDGGDNASNFGQGGGGGGGLIYTLVPLTGNVTRELNGGHQGNYPDVSAQPGNAGEEQINFKAVLNGFLFNSVRSSVTGTQKDSVCINQVPPKLVGTTPIGGSAPYFYQWQKKDDHSGWADIPGAISIDYEPGSTEPDTVFFRRIVRDSSPTPLVDFSKEVEIIVQPLIEKNIIGSDTTICYSQNIDPLISLDSLKGGNKLYSYRWETSNDNLTYTLPSESYTGQKFRSLSNLVADRWFRRTVVSGRCSDVSVPVKVKVLNAISNNKIINDQPQEICDCDGMVFDLLEGTSPATSETLAGGDGIFRYEWQSFNGTGWDLASGTNNEADYNPAEITQTLRRVVYSGPDEVCQSITASITLQDFPAITNNSISIPASSLKICSGTAPEKISGSQPLNGNGTYTYAWQDSTKSHGWTFITDSVRRDFFPPVLTDTTWYRRIVRSSACEDFSGKIKIVVHKPVINTISLLAGGIDTVICRAENPNRLKGYLPTGGTCLLGDYTYQWLYSVDNVNYNIIPGEAGLSFDPPVLNETTYYKRQVTSGECSTLSDAIKIVVLAPITNNIISNNQTICRNTAPQQLTGEPLSGGSGSYSFLWQQSADGVSWTAATGINNDPSGKYSPPVLGSPVMYRRLAASGLAGCCTSVSNTVQIGIHPSLPEGEIANTGDTTICSGSNVILKFKLTGAGPWKIRYDRNSTIFGEVTASSSRISVTDSPVSGSISDVYTYSICSVEDANGCIAPVVTGLKKVTVYKVPSAVAGNDTSVCGNTVTLKARPGVGTGEWLFPSGLNVSSVSDPGATFTADSLLFNNGKIEKRISWKETNWRCSSTDTINVTFYKRVLNIDAGPDTTLYSFDNIFHPVNNTPRPWENGTWELVSGSGTFGDNSITDLSEDMNSYKWTITNGKMLNGVLTEGCSVSDIVNVEVKHIEIPEGFSPNNDPGGFNNTFVIRGLDLPNQVAELKIINSAGTEVYSTSNIDGQEWTDWDGKNIKGMDMPEGTYYYLLRLISKNNNSVFKKSGFLILKRY